MHSNASCLHGPESLRSPLFHLPPPLPIAASRPAILRWLTAAWLLAAGFASPTPAQGQAQAPRLEIESVNAQGVQLVCRTASDDALTLEASFSLGIDSWFIVGSATPTNGVARFLHGPEWRPEAIYYRARLGAPPETPGLIAETDPLRSDAGLLTAEEGIRLQVRSPQGVVFEFVAGTNLVTEPTPIRMTLITNLLSSPARAAWQTAVAFEPEGFRFRRDATLRITFPTNLPLADLLAYSFDSDGSGFHLRSFEGASNIVVLPIDSFSGKGVGAFPEEPPPPFTETHTRARDAARAAEDRAARRERQITRDEYGGRITEQEAAARRNASNLQRIEEVYRDSIRPFENAARSSCDIGRALVVLDLEKLTTQWSKATGRPAAESPYTRTLLELAAAVRCRCAQERIDRCENEPGVSGSALLSQLTEILSDLSTITGTTAAQGCALGSDAEILQRLQNGPCFGDWEGSITLTRRTTRSGVAFEGTVKRTWDNELTEAYIGRVTGIRSQSTFTVRGNRVQSWTLTTEGPYAASRKVMESIVEDDPRSDVISRHTMTSTAAAAPKSSGGIILRLVNGAFDSLGCDARPIAEGDRNLRYTTVDDTTYECRASFPKDQECPSGRANVSSFNIGLYMGFSIDTNSVPAPVATVLQRSLILTWSKTERFDNAIPSWPPEFHEERIVLNLLRK